MNSWRTFPALLGLIIFCALPGLAQTPAPETMGGISAHGTVHYLPPDSIDLRAALGDPPGAGSAENARDLAAVLARQQARTRAEIGRAQAEETLDVMAFQGVFGDWFTAANLPATFTLLENAEQDAHGIAAKAKDLWQRPRPPLQDSALNPAVKVPASSSYPSFHATRGALWAAILVKLDPDLRDRILARGNQIGEDRVLAGVHFPTDVAAGQKLGRMVAEKMFREPNFQRDLAAAAAEWKSVSKKAP